METDRAPVHRLFPTPPETCSLRGLYLAEDLRSASLPEPFVYGNYITSLDGRIALGAADTGPGVPDATANARDWRLFQELAVQADVLLASGSYFRRRARGSAQEILTIETSPETDDLREWRASRGLPHWPDVAVVSQSLDFPVPELLTRGGRRLWVLSPETASQEREAILTGQGARVVRLPGPRIEGTAILRALTERGYGRIYNAAGPAVHHLLLAAGRPDRLYLTFAPRILAGGEFFSLVSGPALSPSARFRLRSLYLDRTALEGDGQLFACYERVGRV